MGLIESDMTRRPLLPLDDAPREALDAAAPIARARRAVRRPTVVGSVDREAVA